MLNKSNPHYVCNSVGEYFSFSCSIDIHNFLKTFSFSLCENHYWTNPSGVDSLLFNLTSAYIYYLLFKREFGFIFVNSPECTDICSTNKCFVHITPLPACGINVLVSILQTHVTLEEVTSIKHILKIGMSLIYNWNRTQTSPAL